MKKPQPIAQTESTPDAVWGAAAIGKELGLSAAQVRYLLRKTAVLNSAVKKVSHKVIVGSRSRLRNLAIPQSPSDRVHEDQGNQT
jgi:orotate phosphoribosyltransferase-like protein